MRGRRTIAVLASMAILELLACRELTTPLPTPDVVPSVFPTSGRLVDGDGRPVVGARLQFADLPPGFPFLESMTQTGDDGRFEIELPPGTYRVAVDPAGRSYAWTIAGIVIDGSPLSISPGELFQACALEVVGPPYSDLGRVRVDFDYNVSAPAGSSGRERRRVELEGQYSFRIPIDGPVSSEVSLSSSGDLDLDYEWPDTMTIGTTDTLRLRVELAEIEIVPTIGDGSTSFAGVIDIEATTDSDRSSRRATWDGGILTTHAFAGVGRLRMSAQSAPFLQMTQYVDLAHGMTIPVQLGRYRVEMSVVDPDGASVLSPDLTLYAENRYSSYRIDWGMSAPTVLFLNPARYMAWVSARGYQEREWVLDVQSDSTVTFVLEPDPDS